MDIKGTHLARRLWPSGMSLRTALMVYVLLPIALVCGLGFWWSLRAFEHQVEIRMQHDLEMVARAIQRPVNHALLREREGSIAEALKSAFAMSHVYGAYLYDAEGRRISDSGVEDAPIGQREFSEHVDKGERYGTYGEVGGRDVYSYFVPLTDSGGKITGLLQLTRRYSDFEDQIRKIRYSGGLLFAVALMILAGIVVIGHHRFFGRHLARFTRSIGMIAAGDVRHRYQPGGPVELQSLGRNFNRMMDDIEQAELELEQRAKQQRALEDRLRQAQKMAAIGELAAGVAHELGTPLSLIDAGVQRARRHGEAHQRDSRTLDRISREVRRMEHIIRQLLDFSRRSCMDLRPTRVAHVVKAAVSVVSEEAGTGRTELTVTGGEDCTILLDHVRIEQALVNLLRNAVQASPGGSVGIGWKRAGSELVVHVEDDGAGVDEACRDKLFEPFFTTKPVGKGTGLGLAVVHGIAEEHGGRVAVDPVRAKGACFRLFLPLREHPVAS